MVKRRTFKRSVKATVNRVMSKYARRKMSYVMLIGWNNGTLEVDGQNQQAFNIGDVLSGNTSEFQTLGKQYSMVKLRGIHVEAVPATYSNGFNMFVALSQTNDAITFDNMKNQPNIMLLNPQGSSRMYVPIGGEFTPTNSIQLFTNMKLAPYASTNATCYFTIRVTLYLTFKSNL